MLRRLPGGAEYAQNTRTTNTKRCRSSIDGSVKTRRQETLCSLIQDAPGPSKCHYRCQKIDQYVSRPTSQTNAYCRAT